MSTAAPEPKSADIPGAIPDSLSDREILVYLYEAVRRLEAQVDDIKRKAPEFAENVQTQMTQTTAGRFVLKALGIE
jgi:hypothetical protein